MSYLAMKRSRIKLRLLLIALPIISTVFLTAQEDLSGSTGGLRHEGWILPFEKTEKETGYSAFIFDSSYSALPIPNSDLKITIDSTHYRIIFERQSYNGALVMAPVVLPLGVYKKLRLENDLRLLLHNSVRKSQLRQQVGGGGALVLKVPWEIKSKTFQRIFGSGEVQLKVTGNISFSLSGQLESREGSQVSALQQQNQFRPKFEQQQRFTIEGQVGDKVKIEVQQNSQATFDLENNLKVTYTGYDDEIIQKLEAGNIDLSLPRTNYVTFSGKNKGLFGVKALMKLGDLDVTAIASIEKGEKQKLSVKGGKSGNRENLIKETNYVPNTFFFVSQYFRDDWPVFSQDYSQRGNQNFVDEFEVYISIPDYNEGGKKAWAFYSVNDPEYNNADNLQADADGIIYGEREYANFKKLTAGDDYVFYQEWGVIQLRSSIDQSTILAVAFKDRKHGKFGDFREDVSSSGKTQRLMLIKPQNMTASDKYYGKTWNLMMRNVYFLGTTDIDKSALKLKIRLYNENNRETDNAGKKFINLMGLDRLNSAGAVLPSGDSEPDVENDQVFHLQDGYLFFPALEPFSPSKQDSLFDFDSTLYVRAPIAEKIVSMYDVMPTNRTDLLAMTKFEIAVETGQSIAQTDFDLGFNILPGSEIVKLNNSILERDKDYIIDYFSGQLRITTDEAQRDNADIDIEYERGAIFQLDKKTLFGLNAQYRFNDQSFLGFTGMFLNKSTIEQRVRVGQEPFRNFVWDLNMAFNFQPKFITRFLNYIPLIESKTPSQLSFEAEFAQVLPNPNTQNNEKTGDNDGVGYIDDFEGSRRATTLGIQYKSWVPASVPVKIGDEIIDNSTKVLEYDGYKAKFSWYNPYDRVPIRDIWPERGKKLNANADQRTDVLTIGWKQRPDSMETWGKSWLGLMRSTQAFADQKETKYIEMWVKLSDSTLIENGSRFHFDLGTLSEDYYVKYGGINDLNTEDKEPRNNLLDPGEDIGLDGIPSPDGDPEDNWDVRPLQERSIFPFGVNGTEGNGQAQGGRYPDTEDLNLDGIFNLANDYFSYEIVLDPDNPESKEYFSADNNNGWYQIRVPLKDFKEKIGFPDESFQQILYFRFWLDNLPQDSSLHNISIASLDYVANEWKELGIAVNDSATAQTDDDLFNILVYNTDEHSNNIFPGAANYIPPPGVEGVVDPVTRIQSKEQSLVFRFVDLPSGYQVVGKKNIYEALNISNYRRIKMFLHGDHRLDLLPEQLQGRQLEFILKIGKDINNYYEYHLPLFANWDEIEKRNYLDIDLQELSKASFESDVIFPDPNKEGAWFIAKGNPSQRNIRYLTFAVKNVNPDPNNTYSGEVWFDELRLSDVDKTPGSALRFKTSFKGADVFNVVANFESKDANFHTINEQNPANFQSGNMNYTQSQNVTLNFNLQKLLPEDNAFSIPITAKYSASASIPKFFPQSDKPSGYEVKNVSDKVKSLFGLNKLSPEVDEISSVRDSRSVGAKISRNPKNPFWLTDITIDQLSLDVDLVESSNRDFRTEYDDLFTFRNKVAYKIPWGKNNYLKPFYWGRKLPLIKSLSGIRFYYTPSISSFNANINHQLKKNKLRTQLEAPDPIQNTTTSRSYQFEYKIFDQLSFKTGRSWGTKVDHLGWDLNDLYRNIFNDFNFGESTNIKQTAQVAFAPNLSSYFKLSYNASSNFNYTVKLISPRENTGGNGLGQKVSLSFKPNQLLRMVYNPDSKQVSSKSAPINTRVRGRRGGNQVSTPVQTSDIDSSKVGNEGENSGFSIPNPLVALFHIFDSWSSMKLDYNRTENSTYGFLAGMPTAEYQFGISRQAAQLDSFPGRNIYQPVFKNSDNITAGFGVDIARNVSSSIDYKWSHTKSWGVSAPREDFSQSMFAFMPDAEKGDAAALPLPNWSFSINGLEKLPFIEKYVKKITINHARSGDQKEAIITRDAQNPSSDRTTSNNFSPLLGIRVNFLSNVNVDAKYNISQTYASKSNGENLSWNQNKDFSLSLSYSASGGFSIPIPLFGIDEKIIKNQMDFSLTFSTGDRIHKTYDNQSDWVEREKTTTWGLKPAVNFALSKRVRGSVFYEQTMDENKVRGKTTIKKFGINVNLEIRE